MAETVLRVDLEERGGFHQFKSAEDVRAWIEEELTSWRWLSESEGLDQFGLWGHVSGRLVALRERVVSSLNQGQPLPELGHAFTTAFRENGETILHGEGELGRRVQDIFAAEGAAAARAAYALATRRASLQQMTQVQQLRGAMLLAVPSLTASEGLSKRLAAERRNLRDRTDRLIHSLEEEASARWQQHQDDRKRGRQIAVRWARRRFGRWQSQFDLALATAADAHADFGAARERTTAEFADLKAAFLETMRLQAPANYWEEKAAVHKRAEDKAQGRLQVFFPLALLGLLVAFGLTGFALLKYPPAANATAIYVVISGGLAVLAGVVFWIGRLLTKLYLSEHHLRIDAEERQIMTTTYLALTKEKAADEKDRQIILAALFRSTPDGIVRDDGPVDTNVAMLLARLGVPGKP